MPPGLTVAEPYAMREVTRGIICAGCADRYETQIVRVICEAEKYDLTSKGIIESLHLPDADEYRVRWIFRERWVSLGETLTRAEQRSFGNGYEGARSRRSAAGNPMGRGWFATGHH